MGALRVCRDVFQGATKDQYEKTEVDATLGKL